MGLKLLAGRAHFSTDLRRKLLARGFDADEVNRAVEDFERRGYLNDGATARALIRARVERGGVGRARLVQLLERHAVTPSEANAWVHEELQAASYDEEGEARRALAGTTGPRAARRLLSLGFSAGLVSRLTGVEIPDEG